MECKKCNERCEEMRRTFAHIFPLAAERDLPWTTDHIKEFLEKRIQLEYEERTKHFTRRVCRILCEISPPKNHIEDMARIVVDLAKEAERLKECNDDVNKRIREFQEKLQRKEIEYEKLYALYTAKITTKEPLGTPEQD